ncbi:uncharacterized protein LOC126836931 isoform X2 [Adelges cooleyi]|uniref:uncharacterized protein LOC126836931 isoform X2 n=1 Tax=Adelges cooleyi TaxID=133065 RepID=UPI0021803369|nr:uncharacterized protein LOC126836931 isoform X2 [Adelges cooleyi]
MRSARAMLSLDPSGHAVPVDDMTSVTAIAGRSPVGRRMLALFLLVAVFHSGHGSCYFPIHYQGVYVMQSTIGSGGNSQPVQYSQVNITEDAIPIWGHCEKRVGNNNYILVDSYKGTTCIRCINLKLRAPNVIRVHTAEGPQKCYTQQESAEATCPSENDLQYHDNLKDIILYKTKESSGTDARKDYCPIDGRYSFRYALNDGSGGATTECSSPTSLADNCPRGHQLNLRFSGCSFEDRVFAYECLANWEGPGKQRYLALYDTRLGGERRPLYRCALYEEVSPGVIHMALSSDSTCSTDLKNASSGFESFVLTARPSPPLPPQVHMSSCKFPDWAQGSWQNLHVNGNTMVYRDTDMFWTLTWRCIDTTMDNRATDKFLVHGRTQCGEEVHSCLLLKRRGPNVLEFITGQHLSENFNASLCADSNFLSMNWITQGRTDGAQVSPCPIMGDYTGMLPDGEGLCAELASDCDALETMHYTVSECSTSEIYEERDYQCLGQWEENGLTYTYARRKDANTYECFVGSIVTEGELLLTEAGRHCTRNVDPYKTGMKLIKKGVCDTAKKTGSGSTSFVPVASTQGSLFPVQSSTPRSSYTAIPKRLPSSTMKPWKPITAQGMPPLKNRNTSPPNGTSTITLNLMMAIIAVLVTYTLNQ